MLYELTNGDYMLADYDPYPSNPRGEALVPSKMLTFERNYNSIDNNPYRSFTDLVDHYGVEPTGDFLADVKEMNEKNPGTVFLPISVYDHGNRNYYIGNPADSIDGKWDAGYAGVAIVKQDDLNKHGLKAIDTTTEHGMESLREHLNWDLDDYNSYANGEMTYVALYDENGVEYNDSELGGFVGLDIEDNGMLDHANDYFSTPVGIKKELGDISIESAIGSKTIAYAKERHDKMVKMREAEMNRSGENGKKAKKEQKKKDVYDIN